MSPGNHLSRVYLLSNGSRLIRTEVWRTYKFWGHDNRSGSHLNFTHQSFVQKLHITRTSGRLKGRKNSYSSFNFFPLNNIDVRKIPTQVQKNHHHVAKLRDYHYYCVTTKSSDLLNNFGCAILLFTILCKLYSFRIDTFYVYMAFVAFEYRSFHLKGHVERDNQLNSFWKGIHIFWHSKNLLQKVWQIFFIRPGHVNGFNDACSLRFLIRISSVIMRQQAVINNKENNGTISILLIA